jgi:hypothetical protein
MDTMQSARWNNRLKAIALGLGLALSTLTVRHWWSIFNYGHPPCNDCVADFPQFYAGAKLVWQDPSHLYDYAEQLALQRTVDPRIEDTTQPFAYPPFTALVLMPLAWLPFSGAFAVMTLVNVGLLSVVLLFLSRKLGLGKDQSTWLLLSTFCNFGVHSVLLGGQTSIVVLSCVTAFMFAVRTRKQSAAGFWSGCIFFKPQLLVVPFIVIAFKKLWRALFVACLVLMVLGSISIFVVGLPGITSYLRLLRFYGTTESGFGSYPQYMHNLRALLQYYTPFSYARYAWVALIIPITISTMWLNASAADEERSTVALWVGNFLAMMLLTPHLYAHDLTLMIVPAALILKTWDGSIPWIIPSLFIFTGVFPILSFVIGPRIPPLVPMIFLAGYSLCIWTVWKTNKLRANCAAALG